MAASAGTKRMSKSETEAGATPQEAATGADQRGDPKVEQGEVVLSLSELLQDENGEIVLFNDSNLNRVVLAADVRPLAQGEAEPHVTASGVDVAGYHYITFENGTTLYYPGGLTLEVVLEQGCLGN